MRRARVAVSAAVGTAPVRVDAVAERQIGAVVLGEDAGGVILDQFESLLGQLARVVFDGRPFEPVVATMVLWIIVGGYVGQRIIEGIFIKRLKLEIHVWRPIDSRFRLITARRNPNMVILTGALLFRRPDIGLELVAWWTLASLIFHAVRLAQASERTARGERIVSWLEA